MLKVNKLYFRTPVITQNTTQGSRPIGQVAKVKQVYVKDSDNVVKKLDEVYVKKDSSTVEKYIKQLTTSS